MVLGEKEEIKKENAPQRMCFSKINLCHLIINAKERLQNA